MSTAGSDWSRREVESTVRDYFDMLDDELAGKPYSKREHRLELAQELNGRSEGAIEFKHQNISAVLYDMGLPTIEGYKPLSHGQDLIAEVVKSEIVRRLFPSTMARADDT